MDGKRLHADVRGVAADRGCAGRSFRPSAAAGERGRDLHRASAGAALAPSIVALDVARALQGVGGAIVMPLTLTVLSGAVPEARRGVVLGIWGGISGLAVALGPLVGGAIVSGISWHWVFWLNVPIGLALVPFIFLRLEETRGPASKLDLLGVVLGSAGLVGIVWGLVRANDEGWTSPPIVSAFVGSVGGTV